VTPRALSRPEEEEATKNLARCVCGCVLCAPFFCCPQRDLLKRPISSPHPHPPAVCCGWCLGSNRGRRQRLQGAGRFGCRESKRKKIAKKNQRGAKCFLFREVGGGPGTKAAADWYIAAEGRPSVGAAPGEGTHFQTRPRPSKTNGRGGRSRIVKRRAQALWLCKAGLGGIGVRAICVWGLLIVGVGGLESYGEGRRSFGCLRGRPPCRRCWLAATPARPKSEREGCGGGAICLGARERTNSATKTKQASKGGGRLLCEEARRYMHDP
jgi:hypothetical protein